MTSPSPSDSSSSLPESATTSPESPQEPTSPSSPLFSHATMPDPSSSPPPPSSESHDTPLSDVPGDGGGSPPRSTGSRARARLRELRGVCATAVLTAGGIAATILTREGTPEREVGMWVPDEDDVDAISDPLASLASRRLPEGAENPDVTDLVRLGAGLLGYFIKQRAKRAELVAMYEPEPEQPEDHAA